MTKLLRLDPAHPPLWRGPSSLQFGLDAVATIDDPLPWQEHLLAELDKGVPDTGLVALAGALGVSAREVRAFVTRVEAALCRPSTVQKTGGPIVVQAEARIAREVVGAITDAVAAAGFEPFVADPDGAPSIVAPTLLIAHHIIEPSRAAALVREDVPHAPIVFVGPTAIVGPFVRPGSTACLACVNAGNRDADPAWPLLAAQLIGRRAPTVPLPLAAEAGTLAARLIRVAADLPDPVTRSVTLRADSSRRVWATHQPHEECGCLSLQESGTPSATSAPDPATTTASGSGRHG